MNVDSWLTHSRHVIISSSTWLLCSMGDIMGLDQLEKLVPKCSTLS
jgi:hypothetical protein